MGKSSFPVQITHRPRSHHWRNPTCGAMTKLPHSSILVGLSSFDDKSSILGYPNLPAKPSNLCGNTGCLCGKKNSRQRNQIKTHLGGCWEAVGDTHITLGSTTKTVEVRMIWGYSRGLRHLHLRMTSECLLIQWRSHLCFFLFVDFLSCSACYLDSSGKPCPCLLLTYPRFLHNTPTVTVG